MRTFFWGMVAWYVGLAGAFGITLDEAVQQALKSSEQAAVIRETKNRARAEADSVTAFTLPQIDATATYLQMGSGVEVNTGIPSLDEILSPADRLISGKIEASQMLFSGGRIWNSYTLKRELTILSQLQETSQKTELVRQVTDGFVTYLYQQARLSVLQDRVAQRKAELQDATDLFEAGMVTNLDVREAQLNLHVAQDDLRSGESAFHAALVDFNLVIGRPMEQAHAKPDGELARPRSVAPNLARLESLFRDGTQLNLKLAQHQYGSSRAGMEIAEGERWPMLFLVAGGEYSGDEQDEMEESWNAGVQLKWNLYDGGTVSSRKASARADMRSSKAQLYQTRKMLQGTIEKLKTEVDRLDQRIRLQEQTVSLSHENYEDARGLYGLGTMTLTRLGEFNLLYAEARFNLLRLYYLENRIANEIEALIR